MEIWFLSTYHPSMYGASVDASSCQSEPTPICAPGKMDVQQTGNPFLLYSCPLWFVYLRELAQVELNKLDFTIQ
jgi:hypothetical protein